MTSPTIMNREQLLELAALDAYGLLDEFEAELYTRSFHHAPAAVQDEIIRFQSELAADLTLLPQEEPPAELRQRVLQAVSRAIERQHSELAPLATIGRRRETSDNYVDSRYVFRPAALWRAAAFILAGAVAVMAYFWADTNSRANEMAYWSLRDRTHEQFKALIGRDFEDFIGSPTCVRKVMAPVAPKQQGLASILIDSEQAFVVALDLPVDDEQPYTLQVRHADGRVDVLKEFVSKGVVCGLRIDRLASSALAATATWEIIDSRGTIVLRSA